MTTAPAKGKAHEPVSLMQKETLVSFVSGGAAGGASRTVVSPLERLKIIQQVQTASGNTGQYRGVFVSLVRMWKEEGFKGYMRGNGVNCLRIVPYSAVQFTTYEQTKKWLTRHDFQLNTATRLGAGACAGIVSVTATYPLDLVRARLSVASATFSRLPAAPPSVPTSSAQLSMSTAVSASVPSPGATPKAMSALTSVSAPSTSTAALPPPSHSAVASPSTSKIGSVRTLHSTARIYAAAVTSSNVIAREVPGVWTMTLKVMREEGGVRALYRGLIPTALGVAPYNGINFASYELIKGYTCPTPEQTTTAKRLFNGALAGTISQTLTYPLDVLRRKSQMASAKGFKQYNGAIDAARHTLKHEGIKGMYRGMWPNLLKVAPAMATSFYVYETVSKYMKQAL